MKGKRQWKDACTSVPIIPAIKWLFWSYKQQVTYTCSMSELWWQYSLRGTPDCCTQSWQVITKRPIYSAFFSSDGVLPSSFIAADRGQHQRAPSDLKLAEAQIATRKPTVSFQCLHRGGCILVADWYGVSGTLSRITSCISSSRNLISSSSNLRDVRDGIRSLKTLDASLS